MNVDKMQNRNTPRPSIPKAYELASIHIQMNQEQAADAPITSNSFTRWTTAISCAGVGRNTDKAAAMNAGYRGLHIRFRRLPGPFSTAWAPISK